MLAAYLKVNREEKYILMYVAHWLDALRALKNIDIYIVCDKESVQQMLMASMDLQDVRFLKSDRSSPDLQQITQNAIIEKWYPAAYAHLTVFEHAWKTKYDDFWNIDADDTEICASPERVAEMLYVVRGFAIKNRIQLFSLDMWRTVLLGKHWSFGITYTNNGTNWIQLMKQHSNDEAFQRDYDNVSSGRNVDWFITYIKNICDVKIETFYFENMWYSHHSDFVYRQADFGLTYFSNGEKIFPILSQFYGMTEHESLPIADDVIKLDIGLTMDECRQYLKDTSFSKDLIAYCTQYNPLSLKNEHSFADKPVIVNYLFNQLMSDENLLYVICPFNIGDFLINGGLCYALQVVKRKKSCALIACDKFRNSGLDFVGVAKIIYVPQAVMDEIRSRIIHTGVYETDRYIYGHFHVDKENSCYICNNGLQFIDRYRENVFSLPLETAVMAPIISDITNDVKRALQERYELDRKKTIVLMPYANSVTRVLPAGIWKSIAVGLKRQGYIVYTNVAGKAELPIEGTSPMQSTFPELAYIAGEIRCFVGFRSGILDFLAHTDANIFCILYPESWHDDLRRNYPEKDFQMFYYGGFYIPLIQEVAKEKKIEDETCVHLDFPHVKPSELYYSDDAIVEAVLQQIEEIGIAE